MNRSSVPERAPMPDARVFLISYDIASPKRWRKIVRIIEKLGARQQYSVFTATLTPRRAARLEKQIRRHMDETADRLMIVDLGTHGEAAKRATGVALEIVRPLIV